MRNPRYRCNCHPSSLLAGLAGTKYGGVERVGNTIATISPRRKHVVIYIEG